MVTRVTPPSTFIRSIIEEHSLTKAKLAKRLLLSPKTVRNLLEDKQHINAVIALKLGALTGTLPELWMERQMGYDLHAKRQKMGKQLARIKPLNK